MLIYMYSQPTVYNCLSPLMFIMDLTSVVGVNQRSEKEWPFVKHPLVSLQGYEAGKNIKKCFTYTQIKYTFIYFMLYAKLIVN